MEQVIKSKYPDDWNEINLGKSSILKARIGWQGLTTSEYLKTGDYYLVTGTDFKKGFIDWDNCVYVAKERFDQDKFIQLKQSDILVTKDGTIGKVAFINKLWKPTTLNSGVFVIRPNRKDYEPAFLYHILMSNHFDNFLNKLTAGSTISHLYQKDFIHYSFPLPPTLAEQKAIATALSDVDELINKLEKLIEKKKAIKQGAMHVLFKNMSTWNSKKIKELDFDISDGNYSAKYPKSSEFKSTGIPFIRANNIKNMTVIDDDLRFINNELHAELKKGHLKKGDILITNRGDIGQTALVPDKYIGCNINAQIVRINAKGYVNEIYLFYFLRLNKTQNLIQSMQTGSALKQLPVNKILDLEVFIPNKDEQVLIGNTLLDIDKEILSLEHKKHKYLFIKQGMMQELLTGKTRLV